jgi:tryptophan-rich sensory protein
MKDFPEKLAFASAIIDFPFIIGAFFALFYLIGRQFEPSNSSPFDAVDIYLISVFIVGILSGFGFFYNAFTKNINRKLSLFCWFLATLSNLLWIPVMLYATLNQVGYAISFTLLLGSLVHLNANAFRITYHPEKYETDF